jgi:RimJ/RimL family protein N-acetyltransferase
MHPFPTLTTRRLLLRQFTLEDAPTIQRLAGAPEIAAGTFMPHPYEDGMAEQWIAHQQAAFEQGTLINFAIVLATEASLIGSLGLTLTPEHHHGQLGYWIGVPYWNQGYCTEAAQAVLRFGFDTLGLHRIWAPHFRSNPASGRVLQRIGMHDEGCQRAHSWHRGRFEDVLLYGILRDDDLPDLGGTR